MKIIYVHHALRDNHKSQEDDLKELGVKDAELVAELLKEAKEKGFNITKIYSSPYKRCIRTSKIINKYLNVEIIEDSRFNEKDFTEKWIDTQNRIREALEEIVKSHKVNEVVICVTSGVNVASFISLAYKLPPSENAPFIGIPSCSPLIFDISLENFVK